MSLSENIKKFRLEKNLTQEQLAAKLCISAQAVSKWETSDTYPDGTLLLPLARELGVSLDELFGNKSASMPDISRQIIALIGETDPEQRFPLAWDICWQIERGLFNCCMEIDTRYAPDEAKNQHNDSYILSDNGFTMVSNGSEPFFAVFPQPKEGFEDFLADKEALQNIFAALSHDETVNALMWLYRRPENYIFESAVLARDCGVCAEQADRVMEELSLLKVVSKQELTVNNQRRTLFRSRPRHILIALFSIARKINYSGAYSLKSHWKNTPFFGSDE